MKDTQDKIIQISATPETEGDWQMLFALTEKGEVWKLKFPGRNLPEWEKLPPLPQEQNAMDEGRRTQEIETTTDAL